MNKVTANFERYDFRQTVAHADNRVASPTSKHWQDEAITSQSCTYEVHISELLIGLQLLTLLITFVPG